MAFDSEDDLYLRPAEKPRDEEAPWRGPAFDPLDVSSPEPAPRSPAGRPFLLRTALSIAALLALIFVARQFWWPDPETPESAPAWAAAPHVPEPAPPAPSPVIEESEPEPEVAEEPAAFPEDEYEVLQAEEPAPETEIPRPVEPRPREEERIAVAAPPAPEPELAAPPGLLRPGPGVEGPVPLDLPRYRYPPAARGTGLAVGVRLALLVDERGKVIDAVVRDGGPEDLGFQEEALKVARQIPFQPASRWDVPGKMWTEMILEFAE
jgi:TonB family protein